MIKAKFSLKNIFFGIIGIGAILLGSLAFYIVRDRSFDEPANLPQHSTPHDWHTFVKIGLIGDSWLRGHILEQSVLNSLTTLGMPVEVISSGHPGAKSRQIYRNLLLDESEKYSSRKLIMDESLDYLVVIAGVNDTTVHMGKNFYSHHILSIIKTAHLRGIHPIIVEIPEYGIEDLPYFGVLRWIKHLIYRTIFDGGRYDVISDYRDALRTQIPTSLKDNVTLISFDPFIQDYSEQQHLYADPMHLNKDGLQQFGNYLAGEILKTHNKRIKVLK
jgi:lysophospholipase L1-like esterase